MQQEIMGKVDFPHHIRTTEVRPGKWVYVVQLETQKSRPSRKFSTQEEALTDARKLIAFML